MSDAGAIDVMKPFVWLATIAFLIGFFTYLVLGHATPAQARAEDSARPAASSGPASKDWNLPKHI